jgi:prepilin-type N-terminal cleavage/methylation domain-containing protein
MKRNSHPAGFTLIELLVVISLIGLLSSVVLVAMKNARTKGNEAAIKTELIQLRNLYETLATNGNYSPLQPAGLPASWAGCQTYTSGNTGYVCQMSTPAQCALVFAHDTLTNSPDALNLCNNIIKNTGFLEIGVTSNISLPQHYFIVGLLPGAGQYLCFGNSGGNSTFTTSGGLPPSTATGETGAGCPGNP